MKTLEKRMEEDQNISLYLLLSSDWVNFKFMHWQELLRVNVQSFLNFELSQCGYFLLDDFSDADSFVFFGSSKYRLNTIECLKFPPLMRYSYQRSWVLDLRKVEWMFAINDPVPVLVKVSEPKLYTPQRNAEKYINIISVMSTWRATIPDQ